MCLKKIVFLHTGGYYSPIPRVHIMAETLVKQNYEVTVICIDENIDSHFSEINGVKIFNIISQLNPETSKIKNLLYSISLMKRLSVQIEPNAIQIFSPLLISLGIYLKKTCHCKLIYDCYEYWLGSALTSKKYHLGIVYVLNHLLGMISIDGVIYVYDKNPTRKIFNFLSNNILRRNIPDCIIYNIPENKIIPDEIDKKKWKKSICGDDDCFLIGYLGMVMPFKGYDTAIKSLIYLDSNFKLLIIGDHINFKFKNQIDNLIQKYSLGSRIVFTGIVPHADALKYAKICDVGLLLFEDTFWTKYSTPNKLFEYMALSLPIIGTAIPNIKFFIEKYSCGITVPTNNPFVLANVIKNLEQDYDSLYKFSISSKNAFFNNFREEIQMEKLITIYSKILF